MCCSLSITIFVAAILLGLLVGSATAQQGGDPSQVNANGQATTNPPPSLASATGLAGMGGNNTAAANATTVSGGMGNSTVVVNGTVTNSSAPASGNTTGVGPNPSVTLPLDTPPVFLLPNGTNWCKYWEGASFAPSCATPPY